MTLQRLLVKLRACPEAKTWAQNYGTLEEAWAACERADWMLWLAERFPYSPESAYHRTLTLCACACVRTVLDKVPARELRPLRAIETAERWARGEQGVVLEDVACAARAAYTAAFEAHSVEYAAYAAAYAAYAATYSAYPDDDAANAAAYAARGTEGTRLAAIVRQFYPVPPSVR